MGSVNEIIALAESQVGNGGARYWNWYTDNVRPSQGYYRDGASTPYCAEYISWLLANTDTESIYFPDPFAFDYRDIPYEQRIPFANLQRGDIIAFDWDGDYGGDHVGVVVENHGYYLETNEGNVGGYVCDMDRYPSEVLFGIRPYYDTNYLDVDGIFGEETIKALQRALQSHGFYTGYDVDGEFGYYTRFELQNYLQYLGYYHAFDLDGEFGRYSVAALQMHLAAQGFYTGDIDSDWGTYTTESLQECLNAGRF